jgi:ribosomal protein L37AE/L43A
MKRTGLLVMLLLSVACASTDDNRDVTVVSTAPSTYGTLVTCESQNNTRETCRVFARDRMVLVNQQLSDAPCILGRSWGVSSDRNEIWVDNGCRAEFQVGGSVVQTAAFGRSVTCESQNNGKARCPVDTSYGVQLARQISDNTCVKGSSWGFDENGIWVDDGCRAEFVLGGDTRYTPMTSSASRATITCESHNEGTSRCPADTFWGVALARQISKSTCVRGQTWGYDAAGIWVSGGCRAEFVVGQ